ncbi:MAG: hypothetical protein V3V10_07215 [Planctomycetota bacterium]
MSGKANALGNAAAQRAEVGDVKVARQLVVTAVQGRRSAGEDANKIVAIADGGDVDRAMLRLDLVNLKTGADYIDTETEANRIYPWKDGSASRPSDGNTLHVWTHMALILNSDIQQATLDELFENGELVIHHGDKGQDDIVVPLHTVLNKYGKAQYVGGGATDVSIEAAVAPGFAKKWFAFGGKHPLVVLPTDTKVYCYIRGLTGTIAGSTPILSIIPMFKGYTAEK